MVNCFRVMVGQGMCEGGGGGSPGGNTPVLTSMVRGCCQTI